MEHIQTHHTNQEWYPFAEFGSYYRLQNGNLLQLPMLVNGAPSTEVTEVDWYHGVDSERKRLKEILRELE
jgi:hypothetical protein